MATIVIVRREESADLDWEVVADSTAPVTLDLHRAELTMTAITGVDTSVDENGRLATASMSGPATVVRFVDSSVVFRGDGPLDGFDESLFPTP